MRRFTTLVRVSLALSLCGLAACASSSTTEGGGSSGGGSGGTVKQEQTLQSSAGGASTTIPPRSEPAGKITMVWHLGYSPVQFDPQEAPTGVTNYAFYYMLHDSLVKHFPGQQLAPSLAVSYKVAEDYKSATFTLRDGIKFHNGEPITAEDVKFSFENYKGVNSKVLKDMTEKIETPDPKTVNFTFKSPFLDFLTIYGTPASGAGWIVPKKYYTEVGADGFKAKPVGAGPYKFVRGTSNSEFEFEAVADYWRKSPNVKTIVVKHVTDEATRFAALATGEADMMTVVSGGLLETAKKTPGVTLAQFSTAPFWLELVGWEKPDSPFNNVKVRQAISLALDRKAINDAETGGFSKIDRGYWMEEARIDALPKESVKPEWSEFNLTKAKQLMAEAGFPNGFEVSQLTPLPPYNSLAERVITQLGEIGIKTKLNKMDRAAFLEAINKGQDALPGIVLNVTGLNGDSAGVVRAFATCKGVSSRTCVPEIDAKMAAYDASINLAERQKLVKEAQQIIGDQWIFPYVYNVGLTMAHGPRIANPWQEIWYSIPQYPYAYPYEDIKLK
ncbi:MAG: ABC transporter substrate-binding protein [Acidimicrobiales bacterium]